MAERDDRTQREASRQILQLSRLAVKCDLLQYVGNTFYLTALKSYDSRGNCVTIMWNNKQRVTDGHMTSKVTPDGLV